MPYLLGKPPLKFRDRRLLFIDLELTGLDPNVHEITEIAALLVDPKDLHIINSFYTKTHPLHPQTGDSESLKVSGYDPKKWQEAIPIRQALEELSAFAPDCTLVGWCIQTEWDFLNAALEKESLPYFYDHRLIEVYSLAYPYFYEKTEIKYLNLSTASRYFNIHLDYHLPDSDIRATYEIYKKLTSTKPPL